MIKYSPRAARALGVLKAAYNEIEIYVEDTSTPQMWLRILRKLLPPHVKLNSVTSLGGRDNVLSACKLDQSISQRRRLYIIDGDFDFLLGRRKPRLKHLYRLRAYCVESLLIAEDVVTEFGCLCRPDWSKQKVKAEFRFEHWQESNLKALRPLFVLYAAAYGSCPKIQTVGFPVNRLIRNTADGPEICLVRSRSRMRQLARAVQKEIGLDRFWQVVAIIKQRQVGISWRMQVSGKDYLLELLRLRMRRILNFRGDLNQLKAMLAANWSTATEPYFARRVRQLA